VTEFLEIGSRSLISSTIYIAEIA